MKKEQIVSRNPKVMNGALYQINLIRSFLIAVSIVRHGDLAGQIPLIGY